MLQIYMATAHSFYAVHFFIKNQAINYKSNWFQLEVDDETLTDGIGLLLPGNLAKDAVILESK